jgi:hypothetical protein
VQAQNRDGCGCAPTAFDVGAAVPAGWGATVARTASIVPGASTTTSIAVTPAQAAQVAFYPLTINARNVASPSLVATAPSTVAIQSTTTTTPPPPPPPPTVTGTLAATVAAGASSYRRPRSGTVAVPIVTTVRSNGAVVAGATVSVDVRDPRGNVVSGTVTTGANGTATFTYSLRYESRSGKYVVTSRAQSGAASATATASFNAY